MYAMPYHDAIQIVKDHESGRPIRYNANRIRIQSMTICGEPYTDIVIGDVVGMTIRTSEICIDDGRLYICGDKANEVTIKLE